MPVQAPRTERPLIELFLSAYDNDTFKECNLDWLEDKKDGAVEVLATARNGQTVAIEHTIVQPFVGEKVDTVRFMKAFSRMEEDASLVRPERHIDIGIPVEALPTGYDWDGIGEEVRAWLEAQGQSLPLGLSRHAPVVGGNCKKGPFPLTLNVRVTELPGMPGMCRIGRYGVPENLGNVVEQALRTKLPKLASTPANKRIFLVECDQVSQSEQSIYTEMEKREIDFPDLKLVDEIWFANTAALDTEQYVTFALIDSRGLVELLTFQKGILTNRRDDRPNLQ